MKSVILSADSEYKVYLVPDPVAENLSKFCKEFNQWLCNSPDAKKYHIGSGVCYTEKDFIEYLNTYIFPKEKSTFVKNLGWVEKKNFPEEYKKCPAFNF